MLRARFEQRLTSSSYVDGTRWFFLWPGTPRRRSYRTKARHGGIHETILTIRESTPEMGGYRDHDILSIVRGNRGPRHQATAKALLEAGADPQLADGEGRTPLDLARVHGFKAMVAILSAAGAR
jgi:hypothetical protein